MYCDTWNAHAKIFISSSDMCANYVFPGKGPGPGFSLCSPSGSGVPGVSEQGRRINLTAFLRV